MVADSSLRLLCPAYGIAPFATVLTGDTMRCVMRTLSVDWYCILLLRPGVSVGPRTWMRTWALIAGHLRLSLTLLVPRIIEESWPDWCQQHEVDVRLDINGVQENTTSIHVVSVQAGVALNAGQCQHAVTL